MLPIFDLSRRLTVVFFILCFSLSAQGPSISGSIRLPGGAAPTVPVDLTLVRDDGSELTATTDGAGFYSFDDLVPGEDYTVSPSLDLPYSGVCLSLGDLCLQIQHVQGELTLSETQLLQADINEDGSLDGTDINLLRNTIMNYGASTAVPGLRFAAIDELGEPTAETVISFNNLGADQTADFFLLPLGDLDSGCPDELSPSPLALMMEGPEQVAPGEAFCIDVKTVTYENLQGFQVGFRWVQFMSSFTSVEPGTELVAAGFNVAVDAAAGFLGTSYYVNPSAGATFPPGTVLFTACFATSPNPVLNEVTFGFGDLNDSGLSKIIGTRGDCEDFNGLGDGPGSELIIPIGTPAAGCDLATVYDGISLDLCCYDLDLTDSDPNINDIFGLRFTTLDGNTINTGNEIVDPGFSVSATGATTRLFTETNGGPLPATTNFYSFCFDEVLTDPQYILLEYLADDLETVICTDSLFFECPVDMDDNCEIAGFDTLNISTGVDLAGLPLPNGTPDNFWELINLPPVDQAIPAAVVIPNTYAVWPFQNNWNTLDAPYPVSKTISVNTIAAFGADNLFGNQPWRVRRNFCLCEEAEVTIAGTTQADDQGIIRLYQDANPATPYGYIGNTFPSLSGSSSLPFTRDSSFNYTAVLPAGSYHLEYEMLNLGSTAMGFNVAGQIYTTGGGQLLTDRFNGCENGVITVQKLNDLDCNGERDPNEGGLGGWAFNLRDTMTNITLTGTTDINGELVFRLLPFGTYEITEVAQAPWMPSSQLPIYVTIDNTSAVQVVNVLNKNPESCTCIDADIYSIAADAPNGGCCYELRVDNDFGPFYDSIALVGTDLNPTLLAQLAAYGTVTTSGDTLLISGLVPTTTDLPVFQFCIDLEGSSNVEVIWYAQGEVICSDLLPVECPDDCLGFQVENTATDPCCLLLDYDNIGTEIVQALDVRIVSGANIDAATVSLPTGYWTPNSNSGGRLVTRQDAQPLPADVDSIIGFCFQEVTDPVQVVVIDYLAPDYSTVICSDTLYFECDVDPTCLDIVDESIQLDCEEEQLRLSFLAYKPLDYLDSVGRIKVHITAPASLQGTTFIRDLSNPLYPGQSFFFDTTFNYTPVAGEDSLCILITAHDGPEERICCFADSLCLPIPVCNPCDYYSADLLVSEEDSCCYYLVVEDYHPQPGYFDSLELTLLSGPTGFVSSFNYVTNGNWTGNPSTPNAEWSRSSVVSGPDTIAFLCLDEGAPPLDTTFFQLAFYHIEAGDTTVCLDTLFGNCPIKEVCDSLSTYLEFMPVNGDSCCFDLYIVNNLDPLTDPVFSVDVDLLSGPAPTFSGVQLLPLPAGWNFPTINVPDASYTYTFGSGPIPQGSTKLLNFCIQSSFSTDSTYVEVAYNLEAEVCLDTVAAVCSECVTVINDSLYCDAQGNYLYRFGFTNYSDYPVNVIRILPTNGSADNLLNGQTIQLAGPVPIGSSFVGQIPVQFQDLDADGNFCFDIILRQVLPEQDIDIFCCYATHCIDLPPCDELPGYDCPDPGFNSPIAVDPDLDAPVCGCDGNTYQNWTFALDADVINWTAGECEDGNEGTGIIADIDLFPNPVDGVLLLTGNLAGPAEVEIVSFTGRSELTQNVTFGNDPVRIDVSRQVAGVYAVLVRYPDGQVAYRQYVKQ